MRGRGDRTPVVICSGTLLADDVPVTSPPAFLLNKPFAPDELVGAVAAAVAVTL